MRHRPGENLWSRDVGASSEVGWLVVGLLTHLASQCTASTPPRSRTNVGYFGEDAGCVSGLEVAGWSLIIVQAWNSSSVNY